MSSSEFSDSDRVDDPGSTVRLRLRGLEKCFHREDGAEVRAIDDVSLDIAEGEIIVLLGPSGCGKTTLLRSVAGLEHPDAGTIEIDGVAAFDVERGLDVPPEKRSVGMVFQSYALWPHMTVAQNVAYPLKMRGLKRKEIGERVERTLENMRIGELADQNPGAISGGQQQRVALARAVVTGGGIILFDEPLSNVDAKVREHLRLEILAMQRELGFTALYVTHDQDEAMAVATKIAVLEEGRIAQLGTPQEVYFDPATLYVARFVGSANELNGVVRATGEDGTTVETVLGEIVLPSGRPDLEGQEVVVVSRPERWELHERRPSSGVASWQGEVKAAGFVGSHVDYLVDINGIDVQVWAQGKEPVDAGSRVWLSISTSDLMLLPKEG